jgi:hypothetical protein
MPAEIRTPFTTGPAQQAGNGTWRKKVLPVGTVNYKGMTLNFDQAYLQRLATSFNDRAYDQVPFQIADAKNTHTNDPERFRGDVLGMDVKSDGLWVTVRPTPEGNRLLLSNPKLGVSARIVEEYERSDGKFYPAAIQHVLGTLDPRIPGLGAWETAAELSNAPEMIIDLSAAQFAGEEGGSLMPGLDPDKAAKLAQLLELDPDALNAMLAQMDDPGFTEEDDDNVIAAIETMSDDEFAALQAEFEIEDEPELVGAGADLSNGYGMSSIDLTNYELAETQRQMSVLQGQHDLQAYENEKRTLANKHNVPTFITELARPLLEGTGHVIEMSNGSGVDAGLVMRRVLQAFGGALQGLGLDSPVELGTQMDSEPDTSQQGVQARENFVSRYRSQTGI